MEDYVLISGCMFLNILSLYVAVLLIKEFKNK